MDLLTSILNNIDEGLIATDSTGKIIFFNEVAFNLSREILEKPIQEGDLMVELVSPSRKELVRDIYQKIGFKRQAEKSFAEYVNHLGNTFYLELNYVPVVNGTDEIEYVHTFIRDITPQKIFEMKLTTQAANISNLIDKANAIIIGVDRRGYVTEWNEYCHKITGFEKDEVYAQKLTDILLTDNEKHFDELVADVLEHESVSNYEIPILTKEKKRVIFLLNGTQRKAPTREVTGVLFIGQDITELSAYRKSLEKKVKERTHELRLALAKEKEMVDMKSRFVSIASHEFRTPLSSIEYAVNAIRKQSALDNHELNSRLNTIDKQVRHMKVLLDDVLTYNKSEAGKIQLVLSEIDLPAFFKQVMEDVRHTTKETHQIGYEVRQIPKKITSDEKLFRNVLINLLTNAIKFSPGKPQVHLMVWGDGTQLHITVRDEGIGIPENEVDKIFEAFRRANNTTSIQGTGLGLTIVKKAIELLEGQIEVESRVGEGTTFTVMIPYHES